MHARGRRPLLLPPANERIAQRHPRRTDRAIGVAAVVIQTGVSTMECLRQSAVPATVGLFTPIAPPVDSYSICTSPASATAAASSGVKLVTFDEIFIEQNFGPHMEQKCASLKPSSGRVSSCMARAVSGSSERSNWRFQSKL